MFGERLKLARKRSGLSLRALSHAIDGQVSAQALGKYERGEMMPSSDVLIALSRALGVTAEFLLSEQVERLEAVEFRKKSATSAKERYRVEAEVIEQLERYLSVEKILELPSHDWQAPFDPVRLAAVEEAEDLAERLRKVWDLGDDPIPNMTELLEENGLKVLVLDLPVNVSGLTCLVGRGGNHPPLPVIVVNGNHTLERRRLTLAHELGHRLIDDGSPADHEKAVTRFSGAFLMPRGHLVRMIGDHRRGLGHDELMTLKRLYRVSAAALLVRLRDIGVIDQATLTYAFQSIARDWRKNEPSPLEPRTSSAGERQELPRRFERLCYRALAERLIGSAKAVELLQRPLADIERAMKGPAKPHARHRQ